MEDWSCGLSAVITDENGSVLAASSFQKLSQDKLGIAEALAMDLDSKQTR